MRNAGVRAPAFLHENAITSRCKGFTRSRSPFKVSDNSLPNVILNESGGLFGEMMDRHVLSALVRNHAGVLTRISGLFSRRGYNIESLTVGETTDPEVSRMTIVVRGDDAIVDQIKKQLEKQIDTVAVHMIDSSSAVLRELVLIKVAADDSARPHLVQLAGIFRARVVDVGPDSITIEATGDQGKIGGLLALLEPYGIRELARTGITALERGSEILSLI